MKKLLGGALKLLSDLITMFILLIIIGVGKIITFQNYLKKTINKPSAAKK